MRSARLFIALFIVSLTFLPPSSAQELATGSEKSVIEQMVNSYMRPYLTQVSAPGAIVGVSIHGHRYFFTYGNATDRGTPFTPNTLVEIGSCTKVFTTTLFALAVDRKQIAPDDSAQKYMPRKFNLQPLAQQITLKQLADFTSGMPDGPPNLPRRLEMRGIEHYTKKDFLHWVSAWQPASPPPAPYLYSNAGIGLLSYLVADATGKSWEEQLNGEIVGPLGLTDTELRPNSQQMERMAQGHRANGMDAPPWPVFAWYAAGALRSTAIDMLRFGEANLGHQQVDGRPVSSQLIFAMKLAQMPIYLLPNGRAKQGMAWVTNLGNGQPGAHPEVLKNGGTAGFGTVILINPSKDAAIFIAVNQSKSKPAQIAIAIGRHLP